MKMVHFWWLTMILSIERMTWPGWPDAGQPAILFNRTNAWLIWRWSWSYRRLNSSNEQPLNVHLYSSTFSRRQQCVHVFVLCTSWQLPLCPLQLWPQQRCVVACTPVWQRRTLPSPFQHAAVCMLAARLLCRTLSYIFCVHLFPSYMHNGRHEPDDCSQKADIFATNLNK